MLQISSGLIVLLGIIILFGIISRPPHSKRQQQQQRHPINVGADGQRATLNSNKLRRGMDTEAANAQVAKTNVPQQGIADQAIEDSA